MNSRSFTIIAVRHGETEWNLIGKAQNLLDSPLTMKGKRQIHQAGQYLSTLEQSNFDVVYTSQLGRAMSSAKTIARHLKLPVITYGELNEFPSEEQRNALVIQWLKHISRCHKPENPILLLGHGDWIKTLASIGTPKQTIKTPKNGEIVRINIEM